MSIYQFLINQFADVDSPFILAIILGIIFLVVYDTYHFLVTAVLSWFKK